MALGDRYRHKADAQEQKVPIVLSTSVQSGDAGSPDAEANTVVEADQSIGKDGTAEGNLSKADRIRIENAATRYLLEESVGNADDWSTF